ncbi:MAG: pilus assembly PilX N-terminal domain-containing protein [Thermodesulfobacteriota bacterium]
MTPEQKTKIIKNEKGIALITALLFLMVLTVLGTTAVVISSTDIKIGGNYRLSKQAFYDAEAGIQYAIKNIENGLISESLILPSNLGDSVAVSYTVPDGFYFDSNITLTNVDTNNYKFQVTGNAANNTSSTIEVVIKRETLLNYGIFGDDEIDMKNSGAAYSYDSSETPNPTPADSTGEADIGSNEHVITHNGTIVDGDIALGEDESGNDAVYEEHGGSPGPTVTGVEGVDVDRVNPDPLGIIGGDLATTFAAVSSGSNDNAWGGIVGNTINLGNGDTMTLRGKAGGANYYVTSIDLKKDSELIIDASDGPVNIYLTGSLDTHNDATINLNGLPPDFTIYSNSTAKIDFKHGSTFKGTVYAPYADIDMKNSSEVYGILWGKTVDIKNSGQFFFDTSLKDKFASNDISIVSWREVRE